MSNVLDPKLGFPELTNAENEPKIRVKDLEGSIPLSLTRTTYSIRIIMNGVDIGMIQTIHPTQRRAVARVQTLPDLDKHLDNEFETRDIVPAFTDGNITATLFVLYKHRFIEALYDDQSTIAEDKATPKIIALEDITDPFDIVILAKNNPAKIDRSRVAVTGQPPGQTPGQNIETGIEDIYEIYKDCWISNSGYTVNVTGNLIINEDVTIEYRRRIRGVEASELTIPAV